MIVHASLPSLRGTRPAAMNPAKRPHHTSPRRADLIWTPLEAACVWPRPRPAMQMPQGYNSWPDSRTEEMIRFHVDAANYQLQQAYYAFAAAVALNRTLVIPRYRCGAARCGAATRPGACAASSDAAALRVHAP